MATSYRSSIFMRHPTMCYFVLAYALSWSITIPLAAAAQNLFNLNITFDLHYLAQVGPAVAAITMTALTEGRTGLRDLAGRALKWRVGWEWLLVSIGSPIALFTVSAVVARIVDGKWIDLRDLGRVNFLPYLGPAALVLWLISNGFGEEIGWRGFALPRLQQRHRAFTATLILSAFWALWHVPAFFYIPSYRDMGVTGAPGFFIGLLSGAILFTWLYNSTGGSILMVAIWHGLFNFFTASAAGTGTVAMVMSIGVMVWAATLVIVEHPTNLAARPRQTTSAHQLEPS